MSVREAHPQPFTAQAAAMAAGHVRRRPGLVDEHKALRIGAGLSVEPVRAFRQDVRAILPDGVAGLFFRVMPWRRKNRQSQEVEAATPRSDRCWPSSTSVISGVSPSAARITAAFTSIL